MKIEEYCLDTYITWKALHDYYYDTEPSNSPYANGCMRVYFGSSDKYAVFANKQKFALLPASVVNRKPYVVSLSCVMAASTLLTSNRGGVFCGVGRIGISADRVYMIGKWGNVCPVATFQQCCGSGLYVFDSGWYEYGAETLTTAELTNSVIPYNVEIVITMLPVGATTMIKVQVKVNGVERCSPTDDLFTEATSWLQEEQFSFIFGLYSIWVSGGSPDVCLSIWRWQANV